MKSNKLIKYLKLAPLGFVSCIILPLSSCYSNSIVYNDKQENNSVNKNDDTNNKSGLIFNGKYYSSVDQALDQILDNSNYISDLFMIGDLDNAIVDTNTNAIDESKLRPYDSSKIKKLYLTASNKETSSLEEAKKSFINEGLIVQKYDDLYGNLFNNFEDAERSLRSHSEFIGVPYYEIKDYQTNKTYKINPLNIEDINKYKEIALKNAQLKIDNEFDIKIFRKDNQNNFIETKLYDLFQNNFPLDKIIDDFNEYIYNSFLKLDEEGKEDKNIFDKISTNILVKPEKPDVGVDATQEWIDKMYRFYFYYNGNKSDSLTIKDIKLSRLIKDYQIFIKNNKDDSLKETIFAFFNLDLMSKSGGDGANPYVKSKNWFGNYLSYDLRNAKIYENVFDYKYEGDAFAGHAGTEISVLGDGVGSENEYNGYQLSDARFNLKINVNIEESKNAISNHLKNDTEFDKFFLKYFGLNDGNDVSNLSDYEKIKNDVIDNWTSYFVESLDSKISQEEIREIETKKVDKNASKKLDNQRNVFVKKIMKKYFFFDNDTNGEIDKGKIATNFMPNYNVDKKIDNPNEIKINNDLKQLFGLIPSNEKELHKINKNEIEVILTYKNNPIFSLDNNIIDNFNLKEITEFLSKSINQNDSKIKLDNWINVSDNFIYENNNSSFYSSKNSNIEGLIENFESLNNYDIYNNYFKINGYSNKEDFKNALIKNSVLYTSENDIAPIGNHGIYLALHNYMERYKKVDVNYFSKEELDKNIIKNNNILVLRENKIDLTPLKYGETLGNSKSLNVSLWNNSKNNIIHTNQDKTNAIEKLEYLKPAKVVVIYDLDGKIVSSDFLIGDSNYGDGSYDDWETVKNNALNTYIVKQSDDYVYYLDNNKYIKLKNEINQIYCLDFNYKKYYFPTFDDAKQELRNYIISNSKFI